MSFSLSNVKSFFPNILRIITERWKIIVVVITSSVLLVGIGSQSILLAENLQALEEVKKERAVLASELSYWEQFVQEYQDYRDAYFRMANLQYQLGKMEEAKQSLEKVLGLDPNFENARVLGTKIEAQK